MTGKIINKNRRYKPRPGVKEAAAALGVSYGHLRLCLAGDRLSASLLDRYEKFKKGEIVNSLPSPGALQPVPPSVNQAAVENLSEEFFAVVSALGINVVIVRFLAGANSPLWKYSGLEQVLGRELQSIQAGRFDSQAFIDGTVWNFFHVSKLGAAMNQLKGSIEQRGLLPITTIFHAESAQDLRVWFPASAELVSDDGQDQ